jgi:hypothetical protein
VRVLGEQRHLTVGVTPISAMRIRVDELTDCEAIGLLRWSDLDRGHNRPPVRAFGALAWA